MIDLGMSISEGLREVYSHRFRSFLTMLGIILGVGSLLAMFALTEGIAVSTRELLNELGGLERVGIIDAPIPAGQEHLQELSRGRTYLDAKAIRAGGTLLRFVSPEMELRPCLVSHGDKSISVRALGVELDFPAIEKHVVEHGRFLTHLDLQLHHRVCVIGAEVARELFGSSKAALGRKVAANEQLFIVVGVFQRYETQQQKRQRESGVADRIKARMKERAARQRGWNPIRSKNEAFVVPLSSFVDAFRSSSASAGAEAGPDLRLDRLTMQIRDIRLFEESIQQMRTILLRTHSGVEDFGFDTREDWFESMERSIQATRFSGGLIAGISLLVGGIGITNIMLASISERIREIGIRRAVGARARDIFAQILVESVVLALLGAFLGLVVGLGLIQIITIFSYSESVPVLYFSAVIISVSFALGVGVLAGIYPAWRAASLSPIQALRYE